MHAPQTTTTAATTAATTTTVNSAFGDDGNAAEQAPWPEDFSQEDIFSSQMAYGASQDGWIDDDANLLMLARGEAGLEGNIDPTLGGF